MKKVLFVISALETGGAEKSLVNLLNIMDPEKYQVDLLLFKREGDFLSQVPAYVNIIDGPEELVGLYRGVRQVSKMSLKLRVLAKRALGALFKYVLYRNTHGLSAQQRWYRIYTKGLANLGVNYDVAIAYMHHDPLYFVADKVYATKKIAWVHNDYKELDADHKMDRYAFECFDHVVTISDECLMSLSCAYPDMQGKFVCLPNLTSEDVILDLSKEFVPKEYQECGKDVFIIVSVGRLSMQKGFDYSIDAAKILVDKGIDFRWFILGKGELQKELEKQIENNHVSDVVKLIGTRVNPYPYFKGADIVVQTSRFEGKSVVLDEAKIIGKPIVATNYPTVYDQIDHGKSGIIANMDPESIACAIEEMIVNVEKYHEICDFLSENHFGNAGEVKQYYELFD